MPELPEVESVVRGIRDRIVGQTLAHVAVLRPDIIRSGTAELLRDFAGRTVTTVGRLGKRILIHFEHDGLVVIHLGMSGRVLFEPFDLPPAPHTHARFSFHGISGELRFRDPRRFGGIWVFKDARTGGNLKPLGPDALQIRVPILHQIARRSRQIKALLMDQQAISGLGNIYCDEALFRAGIHPLTPASSLAHARIKDLACSIRTVLRESIDSGGSTLSDYRRPDGTEGAFQKLHRVYDREGKPCLRCGSRIRRIIAAGRSTHYCPACQRLRRRVAK